MDRRSSGVVSRKSLALTDDPRVLLIEKIKAQIWPLIEGHGPEIQSAIIADMLATLLAGHAPPIREQALVSIIVLTKQLIPINEVLLFHGRGHPYSWPEETTSDGEKL